MKIRKITLRNHKILGDLELDFTDNSGKCINTIIIAGENGSGKTCILDLLYKFSMFSIDNIQRNEKRIFEIEFSIIELETLKKSNKFQNNILGGFGKGVFHFQFDYNIIGNWNQIKVKFLNDANEEQTIQSDMFIHPEVKWIFKSVYSDVEVNYVPKRIQSVTAKDVDEQSINSYKSGNNLATEITQLLIDIAALDSQDFSQWGKEHVGQPVDENLIDVRIKRFTKAFETMFPNKSFLGIENINGNKEVMFQENDNRMTISQLSSGEKQIVYRGGFLLKDKESNKGSIILIDEPEISMHPTWQIEILNFYKALVLDKKESSSQLFVATHSPFIIHNSNRSDDKVIILTKDQNGEIKTQSKPAFYSWTKSKFIQEAFNINYDLSSSKGKIYLEGITDEKYFNKAKEIFKINDVKYDICWIGRVNTNGGVEFTGQSALNQTKAYLSANPDQMQSNVILYYDSDTNKPEESFDKLTIKTMPKIYENTLYKIGVENLLNLPKDFDSSKFYDETQKKDKYGAESLIRTLNKTKLCDWICTECGIDVQKEILKDIRPLLTELI